jgi:uncharacterized protein YjbJ (UPF0337 family)
VSHPAGLPGGRHDDRVLARWVCEVGATETLSVALAGARHERTQQVSGTADEAKGRVKQAVGDLTDDKDLKREGKVDEGAGKVKNAVDNVKDKLTDDD